MAVPAHLQAAGHFAQREGMMNQHLSPHAPRLADLLIRAAAIYSMAQHRGVYQAIAIRDEWIVAVSQDPPWPGRADRRRYPRPRCPGFDHPAGFRRHP